MEEIPDLTKICPTNPIQVLNLHDFLKIVYVSFKCYFWQKWKILILVLGLHSKDRKPTWDKSNIGNP